MARLVINPSRKQILSRALRLSPTTDRATPDYVSIAIAYAEEAIDDTRRTWACHLLRCAAKRFLKDLRRSLGKRPPFTFSAAWANRVCAFIEQLPHVEGEWDSATITLEPAQIFFVVQLFGFRTEHGRRFSEALYCTARKNAKSTLAAAILLACYCLERDIGPQVITAATTGQQAKIVYNVAKRMVEARTELAEAFDLEPFMRVITRHEVGGEFKAINSKASTQDGLNPSHVNLDEIHAHKTPDLLNVLRSAAGGRKNPLWLYTTTEGYESPGPWAELRNFARQVLEGLFAADHFLAVIFQLDEEDNEYDESKWPKANPLMGVNPMILTEMRKLAINARNMPSTLAEFSIKRLNRQASTASGWINLTKWKKCGGPVVLDDLEGQPCWAGLDMAGTIDMAAWRLLWLVDGRYYTWGRYWVPSEAVRARTERRSVPYAGWVQAGWLTQTEGETIDYETVQAQILQDALRFAPRRIGFDPWNSGQLANALVAEGLPMEQFRQGPQSFHPAMMALERTYTNGLLNHNNDPVLRWNMANLVARRDVNMNMAPDRKKSADKIDGAVALIEAFGLAEVDDSSSFDAFLAHPVTA
jgi:phage terminase large subunit-like protein